MNPIVRTATLLVSALILIAAIGVGAYQLFNIWAALLAVLFTSWLLSRIVNEGMAIGAFFEHQRMKRPDFEDARFGTSDELEISSALEQAAEAVSDADLQEALHHFTHLAAFCPGSKGHAERLQVVLEHLQMRLSASTVQPMSAEERPIVH